MNDPIRISISKSELDEIALSFMQKNYGESVACSKAEIGAWHEKYGMLTNFIRELFPAVKVNTDR